MISFRKHLCTPKSFTELYEITRESEGKSWSKEQLELYLLMCPDITTEQSSGKVYITLDKKAEIVLEALDNAMAGRKLILVDRDVMPLLPPDAIITPAEIIEIARTSGLYEVPNNKAIRRKRTGGENYYGAGSPKDPGTTSN